MGSIEIHFPIGPNTLEMTRKKTLSLVREKSRVWKMVDAAGVEPASLANKPAATTCLVRRDFSAMR